MSPFIPCILKQLPDDLLHAALRTAREINPANAVRVRALAYLFPAIDSPKHIALLQGKYWGPSGVKLGVAFLDTTDASLKARILSHMNAWAASPANVEFKEASQSGAQVRITRTPGGGYWSYLGTDILHVQGPTMNLDSFSFQTPESEYKRVVRHECGHTLGWPHEHTRKELVARLDPAKTISFFMQTQGWSDEQVRQQVLIPLDDAEISQHTEVDQVSIMCYQLPGSITLDGQPITGGSDIDTLDASLCARVYPTLAPPPVHVCPPGQHWEEGQQRCVPNVIVPSSPLLLYEKTFIRAVRKGGAVSFASPTDVPVGSKLNVHAPAQSAEEVFLEESPLD